MKAKIFICYHKKAPIIANEILCPILLGAESATKETIEFLESACAKSGVKLMRDDFISDSSDIANRGGGAKAKKSPKK